MARAKKSAELTTATKNTTMLTQQDVPSMIQAFTEKVAELKIGIVEDSKIKNDLPGFGQISDIKEVETLIEAHSMIATKATAYAKSAKALKIDTKKFPYSIGGHTETEWNTYIQSRVSFVVNAVQIELLETSIAKLKERVSEEQKLHNTLSDIREATAKFF